LHEGDDASKFKLFFSPEKLAIEDMNEIDLKACDAWSIGLIIYFVLTGRDGFSDAKV